MLTLHGICKFSGCKDELPIYSAKFCAEQMLCFPSWSDHAFHNFPVAKKTENYSWDEKKVPLIPWFHGKGRYSNSKFSDKSNS